MYRNLLVPVDGSDLSDKAMHGSIDLARQLGATITAFVAEPTPPLPAVGRTARMIEIENDLHDERTTRHAQEVLRRFEAQARDAGVAFQGHHAQTPSIGDAIVDAAKEHGCDLIVMATHGRGLIGEMLYGAHTKGVMARSKLPLLVLH
ncbi:universal stress protein [Piscinibacter sp.]|uniref:universal stress protein n=1 Tax=Piscinibacter sp. TaxID=1903157 RepID=UPI002C8E649C|nr:universal stress protein [Albitalea sp.]HUG26190.1 universal stress protein [Albitalea sp.]